MARYENGALPRPVWLVCQTGIRLASGFSRGFYGQHNVSIILQTPLTGNAAWRGEDLAGDTSWIHHLSADSIRALDAALAHVKSLGLSFPDFEQEHFPLPEALRAELAQQADALENGLGFIVLRGLPVERYTEDEIHTLYYGVGLHLGQPVRQNPRGDVLGLVINVGDKSQKTTRVYETNNYLPYHTDPSDVVGLLCVRKAKEGGLSSLVSVGAVYNEILRTHPELLGLYYRQWYCAHLCEQGTEPGLTPIFSYHQGKLTCRYLRQYLELGHEMKNLPLTPVEVQALDVFDQAMYAPGLRLDMMLEPGDMQFANNYAVLHSRNGFEDHDEPALRRKLLRLWLKMPNARELAPEFPGRNGFPKQVAVAA